MSILIGILFLFQSVFQLTQPEIVRSNGLNFEKIKTKEYPVSLFQDSRKLIWIGTVYGASVYDGYTIENYTYNLTDSLGFKGSFVPSFTEDQFGRIWSATYEGGINLIKNGKAELIDKSISNWDSRAHHTYWVESFGDIIWVISNESITYIKVSKNLNHLEVQKIKNTFLHKGRAIVADMNEKGEVYFLSNMLYKLSFSDTEGIKVQVITEIGNEEHIYINNSQDLFIPSNSFVNVLRDDRKIVEIKPHLKGQQIIRRVYQDSRGVYWFGLNDGVLRLELNEEYKVISQEHYRIGHSEAIIEDTFGNLFFASNNESILKLNAGYDQFEYVQLPEEEVQSYLHKFLEDSRGNYWAGGVKGLYKYNTKTNEFYSKENSFNILNHHVYGIAEDNYGFIWVGSNSGLTRYDPASMDTLHWNTANVFKKKQLDNFRGVYNLTKGRNGNLWFIVGSRLGRMNPETLEFKLFEEVGDEVKDIDKFITDKNNDIVWVWTRDHELEYYSIAQDELIWNNEKYLGTEIRRGIANMIDLANGQLWFSYKQGILVINKATKSLIAHLNNNDLVPKDENSSVLLDQNGYVWISKGPKGARAIDPVTFSTVYELPEWLYNPANSIFTSTNTVSESGRIFTDGHGGFFTFFPSQLINSTSTPTILVRGLKINQVPIDSVWNNKIIRGLELSYLENDLEFDVTAVQFNNPNRNEYSYLLKGIDNTWSENTLQRTIKYLSLPPGEYSLLVKASNSEGIWSEPTELASFTILPPWWRTNFAYACFFIIIAVGIVGFYRIQLNKRLAESESLRLKEVDEFKTRFFTNITHEFRTPLTIIMGLADRMNHQSVPIIKRNASKLLELINQILELSKVESSSSSLKIGTFDLVSYSNYLVESLETLANEREIKLELVSQIDRLIVVLDKQKVDLILHNLISNALKFTGQGGKVDLKIEPSKKGVQLIVTDTGIGIKEEALPHIFDRFFQSDSEMHKYEGSGIGLALTKELVEFMKGKLKVKSEYEVGSEFAVWIPCTFGKEEDLENQEYDVLTGLKSIRTGQEKSEVILLVEDNNDVRSFIKQVLSDHYEIITAHNGMEGLEKAIDHIPDLIISDVMMPYKDGLELTDEVKNDQRTSHIPLILLTAKADIESRLSGLETGADVYLSKPFNEQELKTHIQNLLSLRDKIRSKYSGEIKKEYMGNSLEDEFLLKIYNTVIANIEEEAFGIEEICNSIGISRTQLHRKLKALTGKSTSIFIRDIRLNEGKKLLQTTSDTVAEIAYKVGFNDPNYFSKLYSEKYSHSPKKEREMTI